MTTEITDYKWYQALTTIIIMVTSVINRVFHNVLQAFEAAWEAACKVEASMMIIPPEYTFLVGPISFSGPYCQPNIVFQVRN